MVIRFRVDIMALLKQNGYTTYKLRQSKLFGESTLQKFRTGGLPSWHEMDVICTLLGCQPGDLVEFIPEDNPPEGEVK